MDNTIIYALGGLLALLLVACIVIWLMGQKKISAANQQSKALSDEKNSLTGTIAVLEEKCSRIMPLELEISEYRKKQEGLQAEITKLTADFATELEKNQHSKIKTQEQEEKIAALTRQLAAEVEKSRELSERTSNLAQKEAKCADLQKMVDHDNLTITALESQVQKEQKIAQQQTTVIDKLKKLFV